MAQEKQNEIKEYDKSAALVMPTKNGRGYKVVVNGVWAYTSTQEMTKMLKDGTPCNFRSAEQIKARAQTAPTTQQVVAPTGVTQ